jgi:hypothetical protein
MTFRVHFILCLTLGMASACVVAGEEDPTLEEIELGYSSGGTATCSNPSPDPGEPGSLTLVAIVKDGRAVSYSSLTRTERSHLDDTVDYAAATVGGEEVGCDVLGPGGWHCDTGDYLCSCEHTSTGPKCRCDEKC